MKNTLLRVLSLLALVFVFSSCQKSEELRPNGSSSGFYSANPVNEMEASISFQYVEFDVEGKMNNGWVIMEDGRIRNFEYEEGEWNVGSLGCGGHDMLRLESAVGEEIGNVSSYELNQNRNKVDAASEFLSFPRINDENATFVAFFAYKEKVVEEHTSNSCNYDMDGNNRFKSRDFEQVLLLMEGGRQAVNQTEAGKEIMVWLENIHNEVYF